MIHLHQVAHASSKDGNILELSLHKKLGHHAFQNITDWPHLWIVYVHNLVTKATVSELVECSGRKLTLKLTETWNDEYTVVDIKPYHFLEFIETSFCGVSLILLK